MDVKISFDIDDITCCVCLDIIHTAPLYRECMACNNPICLSCMHNLTRFKCPTCRSKNGFIKNAILEKYIFPSISTPCIHDNCDILAVKESAHVDCCEHRPIDCPICEDTVSPATLHDHIIKCTYNWEYYVVGNVGNFINSVAELKESKNGYGACITLAECICSNKTKNHNRFLYLWAADNITLNMFSYQMNSVSNATISIMMTSGINYDDLRKIGLSVHSKFDTSEIKPKTIPLSECAYYDNIEVGLGIHSFKVGDVYSVMVEDDGWIVSRVVELTMNPVRVIFVTMDSRRLVVAINLDAPNASEKIKPSSGISARSRMSNSDMHQQVTDIIEHAHAVNGSSPDDDSDLRRIITSMVEHAHGVNNPAQESRTRRTVVVGNLVSAGPPDSDE